MKAKQLKSIVREAWSLVAKCDVLALETQYLRIEDGKLMFSNLSTTVIYDNIPFKGTFSIAVQDLKNLLKTMNPNDEINLVDWKDGVVAVEVNGDDKFTLVAEKTEWLIPQKVSSVVIGAFTKEDALNLIESKKFASSDTLRPSMTGVGIIDKKFWVTDGAVMAWYDFDGKLKSKDLQIILFPDVFKVMERAPFAITKPLKNTISLHFPLQDKEVRMRLIDETQPDYKSVIPTEFGYTAVISKKDMISQLTAALGAANYKTHQIVLTFTENKMNVSAECLDNMTKYSGDETVAFQNYPEINEYRIGFNGKLLLDAVKSRQVNDVFTMQFNAPNRAAVIDNVMIVMPVMLMD